MAEDERSAGEEVEEAAICCVNIRITISEHGPATWAKAGVETPWKGGARPPFPAHDAEVHVVDHVVG